MAAVAPVCGLQRPSRWHGCKPRHAITATEAFSALGRLVWYLAAPEHRPGWIRVDRLLGEHGTGQDSASGELHRETAEQKANRIIAQEMSPLGWTEAELISPLKNDSGKLAMAARVRKKTTQLRHQINQQIVQLGQDIVALSHDRAPPASPARSRPTPAAVGSRPERLGGQAASRLPR